MTTLSDPIPGGAPPGPRAIGVWLLVCCAAIFALVMIGGITRLTDSGLSITEWRPVTGFLPPLSAAAWQAEFERYQAIPEYRLVNAGMTLAEFKWIYFWEYLHRLMGRLVGIVFALPLLWFWLRGAVRGRLRWQLPGLLALGALQGALGWYMVTSGLAERVDVSQYRLVAHLGLAVLIYGLMLWLALDLLLGGPVAPWAAAARRLRRAAGAVLGVVGLTILSGGFVAGLDAGLTYNTVPLMDGRIVPAGYLFLDPWWRNAFENIAAVQFHHRVLAVVTVLGAVALVLAGRRLALPDRARRSLQALLLLAVLQVSLGVATLVLVVPVVLAVAHQAGALLLFSAAIALRHALRDR